MDYRYEDVPEIAANLLDKWQEYRVWCFSGDMGAGKTTLIKAICEQLDVSEGLSSPTFSIVNEYAGKDEVPIYHFDFYRIEEPGEAVKIGVEDYFFSGERCFIEWPEVIHELLPDKYLEISIKLVDENRRSLSITPHG